MHCVHFKGHGCEYMKPKVAIFRGFEEQATHPIPAFSLRAAMKVGYLLHQGQIFFFSGSAAFKCLVAI